MGWSPQQEKALKEVELWWKHRRHTQRVFKLFGYAGTGKTTLANFFAQSLGVSVLFMAFTGKAVKVLIEKDCKPASTIHRALFRASEPDKERIKSLEDKINEVRKQLFEHYKLDCKDEEEVEAKIEATPHLQELYHQLELQRKIASKPNFEFREHNDLSKVALGIVDECSMINNELGQALMDSGVPLLVMGDPAQLPPVEGQGFFTEGQEPDFVLTEIHRQASDNPIIHMATLIREGKELPLGTYGESRVILKKDLDFGTVDSADMNICFKNATRNTWNRRIRHLKYSAESWVPVENEPVICLRNDNEKGLINGAIFIVKSITFVGSDTIHMTCYDDDYNLVDIECHASYFRDPQEAAKMHYWDRRAHSEFDYAHVITGHKAQGSQWEDVVVLNEMPKRFKEYRKWLYTCVTRAAHKITIVEM